MNRTSTGIKDGISGFEALDILEGPRSSMILPFVRFSGTDVKNGVIARLGHIFLLK